MALNAAELMFHSQIYTNNVCIKIKYTARHAITIIAL